MLTSINSKENVSIEKLKRSWVVWSAGFCCDLLSESKRENDKNAGKKVETIN